MKTFPLKILIQNGKLKKQTITSIRDKANKKIIHDCDFPVLETVIYFSNYLDL
jgi:hypothetical protein